jgi:hypothetical protein
MSGTLFYMPTAFKGACRTVIFQLDFIKCIEIDNPLVLPSDLEQQDRLSDSRADRYFIGYEEDD